MINLHDNLQKGYESGHQTWKCSKEMKSNNTGSEIEIKHRVTEEIADHGNADDAAVWTTHAVRRPPWKQVSS